MRALKFVKILTFFLNSRIEVGGLVVIFLCGHFTSCEKLKGNYPSAIPPNGRHSFIRCKPGLATCYTLVSSSVCIVCYHKESIFNYL